MLKYHPAQKSMNVVKGNEISNCWKEFNGEIRQIFSKKVQEYWQNSGKSTLLNHLEETTSTLRFSRKK